MKKNSLGSRIRESRKRNNLTQEQLANFLGISKRTVVYYESDKNSPTVETLKEIAKICDQSPEYLLTGSRQANEFKRENDSQALVGRGESQEEYSFAPYDLVADRIRKSANLVGRTDSEIARVLGVARQSVQGYKQEGKFPASRIVSFCLKNNVSLDWMATGVGPMRGEETDDDFSADRELSQIDVSEVGSRLSGEVKAHTNGDGERFADEAGIDRSDMNDYLEGKRLPAPRDCVRLFEKFGINTGWLIWGKKEEQQGDYKLPETSVTFRDNRLKRAVEHIQYIYENADAVDEVGPLLGRIEALHDRVKKRRNQKIR